MDLKQLEYFVKVGQLGSFSKASTALSVAQPFLSKHIRQLEIELHENLFRRNGRLGLSFTEEGAIFFAHAKKILEQLDEARRELSDLKDSPTGKLVIGAVPDARKILAKNLVNTFLARYPKASLEVIEGRSGTVYEWLMQERIDIAVLYDPPISTQTKLTPLTAQELCLVSCSSKRLVPRNEPIEFKHLATLPLILPSPAHSLRRQLEAEAQRAGIKLNVILEILGSLFILELVHQGHGCTILSHSVTQKDNFSKELQINEIINPRLTKTLVLATSAHHKMTRLMKEATDLVAAVMKSDQPTPEASVHLG